MFPEHERHFAVLWNVLAPNGKNGADLKQDPSDSNLRQHKSMGDLEFQYV